MSLQSINPANGDGHFCAVSALAETPREAPVYCEEVLGPVALLFKARDLEEAIELGRSAIDALEAGTTFINAMVALDPRLPFGGVKRSGYGRELARHGIREFVNAKAVSIDGRASGGSSETE